MQPQSLCVDKAVVTNHHIEQCGTGLLTRDPICLSRHDLAAMLALISHHVIEFSKAGAIKRECCRKPKKVRYSSGPIEFCQAWVGLRSPKS